MTEEQDREISLEALARKFAGGNKESRGGWLRTLREAAKAGTLQVRTVSVPAPGVVKVGNPIASRDWLDRDFQTVGETTFAGMSARVVAPRSRQAITQALARTVHQYVAPAAVAAWLASLPEHATKDIHSQGWAWLGDAWPVAAAPAVREGEAGKPAADIDRDNDIRAYHAERERARSKSPTKDTAEHFGISDGRVRQILRKKPSAFAAGLLASVTAPSNKKARKS